MSRSMQQEQAGKRVDSGPRVTRRSLLKGTAAAAASAAMLGSTGHASARSGFIPPFSGAIVPPGDPRYPSLVVGFNQRFVGAPDAVHVVGDADEVLSAVQNAVSSGKRITVRGGGHCYEDFVYSNTGGVVIDLSAMNHVHVDGGAPDTAIIEGGCTLLNVYTQLFKKYNRTLPGGSCYSVGVGGHVCGGGYGLLSRLHGLTVDHLYGVEVVVVDQGGAARKVTVTRDSTAASEVDLYWAVRGGGGGNFGIITKYLFNIEELPQPPKRVMLWNAAWSWRELQDYDTFHGLLSEYGSYFEEHHSPGQPENALFSLLKLTHASARQVGITVQEAIVDEGLQGGMTRQLLDRLERVAGPNRLPTYGPSAGGIPWIQATHLLSGSSPNLRGKNKSAYMLKRFPADQIQAIHRHLTDTGRYSNPQALLQVNSYGGEVNAVGTSDTAIPQRSSIMKLQYQTYWTDPDEDRHHLDWIRGFYQDVYRSCENLEPTPDGVVDGCYVNYPDADLVDWQTLYYKQNYRRLQQVKARWDPNDVFNHSQSIRS